MKKSIIFSLIICVAGIAKSQVVTATAPQLVKDVCAEAATISPDGRFIVANTNEGIQRIGFTGHDATVIAKAPGATKLKVSDDNQSVVYRLNHFDSDHMRTVSLERMSIADGSVATVIPPTRHLNAGIAMHNGMVTAVADGETVVGVLNGKATRGRVQRAKAMPVPVASISYGHLQLTVGDNTVTLDPLGTGSYLWPTVSPDASHILFHCVGKGTFTCNLDGSDVRLVGKKLFMPAWVGNNVVIGSITTDDSKNFTSGVLTAVDIASGVSQSLTPNNIIALDPAVSVDGKHVVFTTDDCKIYTLTIE